MSESRTASSGSTLDAVQSGRLDLYRYATSDEHAGTYLAIMSLFTARLMTSLSAPEVAERLAATGLQLSVDDAQDRCEQLERWGNLVPCLRDSHAPTIADYRRSKSRWQPTKLGGMVHRQIEDLAAEVSGVREVARELLGGMVSSVQTLTGLLADPATEPDLLATHVTTLFASDRVFSESLSDFYGYLHTVINRYDLATGEYTEFKTLLSDYIHLLSGDVARHAPRLHAALGELTGHLDDLLARLDKQVGLHDVDGTRARRSPGRTVADWQALAARYTPTGPTSVPDQLRAATESAVSQLLANAKRMLAATGTGVSRHGDLRTLARWFSTATDEQAARIFDAAFGLYPARHLFEGDDSHPNGQVAATTSWWDADPVTVAVSLRERGDRSARGRTSPVPDPGLEAARLAADGEREHQVRAAAAAELVAAGDLDGAAISAAALDLLLHALAGALATGATPSAHGASHADDLELGWRLTLAATDGATTLTSPDGQLRVDGMLLSAGALQQATAAAQAELSLASRVLL